MSTERTKKIGSEVTKKAANKIITSEISSYEANRTAKNTADSASSLNITTDIQTSDTLKSIPFRSISKDPGRNPLDAPQCKYSDDSFEEQPNIYFDLNKKNYHYKTYNDFLDSCHNAAWRKHRATG